MNEGYYVTTPIYYVNGAPHIGHAYTSIAADVMARWKRLDGFDVFFLTGTDEHGQKVESAARSAGVDPQTFTDKVSADFRDMSERWECRTTSGSAPRKSGTSVSCAELWRRIEASGNIYLGHYEGWYAVRDEAFYDEEELTTRPDGSKVAPSGAPVEWVREPSYFFKLSEWQDRLLKLYQSDPNYILPQGRRNEVLSFVRGGLRDLSVSRTSFTWGIPVPGVPGHVMYVWLDALNNYVTACGFPDESDPHWHFWPADAHFVGKDILRFHAVYWPAFLMAAGLPVPRRITSNGWWTVDGEKMSKSLGNVIEPRQLVAAFGLDQVRYFLLREKPFGGDGTLSHQALITRANVELANDLGNLAQRTLSLVARNCEGGCRAGDLSPRTTPSCWPRRRLCRTSCATSWTTSCSTKRWRTFGRSSAPPMAISIGRLPGRCAGPIRLAWAPCCACCWTRRAVSRQCCSRSCQSSMGRMLDQLGVPAGARQLSDLATPGGRHRPAGTTGRIPALCRASGVDADRFALPPRLLHGNRTSRCAGKGRGSRGR